MVLSPKDVKKAVSKDLKARNLTHETASKILGMGKQTFSNLLYKDQYFSRAMAVRFHDSFGYALPFLINGEGSLLEGDSNSIKITPHVAFGAELTYIDLLEKHIELSTDILGTVSEYSDKEEIKQILRALIGRNLVVSRARQTLIFTTDERGKEQSHFELLSSLNAVLETFDQEIREKVKALQYKPGKESEK